MSEVVESGTEQPTKGGLPPVETADIRPKEGGDTKSAAKSEKNQDASQPRQQDAGAKDKGPGPWQQKLIDAGLDDPAFDEFLRSEIQPYITQLEQRGGEGGSTLWNGDTELEESAYQIVEALRSDPVAAYRELGEILGLAEPGVEGDDTGELGDDFDSLGEDESDPGDPRMQYLDDLMRREQEEREDAEYKTFLDQLSERVPGFDPDLYSMVLAATPDANLDTAWQSYMKFHRAPTAAPDAPPQLGGPEGATAPPEAPEHKSISDAVSGFLNEDRARRSRS